MTKSFTRFLLLALILTLLGTLLVGGAMAASKKKNTTIVVTTQEELVAALKKYGSSGTNVKICIETNEKATFTLSAKYSSDRIKIVIYAPNATIKSKAKFSSITINQAKSVKEYANGNKITINDDKIKFTAMENSQVEKITVASEEGTVKIVNNGTIENIAINGNAETDLTQNGSCGRVHVKVATKLSVSGTSEERLKITVQQAAVGAQVMTEIPVNVNLYAEGFELTTKEGAEGSKCTLKSEYASYRLDENAKDSVKVKNGVETAEAPIAKPEEKSEEKSEEVYSINYIVNNPYIRADSLKPSSYTSGLEDELYLPELSYQDSEDDEDEYPVFVGWYDFETFEGPVEFIPAGSTGDRTFWALWEAEEGHVHDYSGTFKRAATCSKAGLTVRTCSCGAFEAETLPVLDHTAVYTSGKKATCTETGLTQSGNCIVCGAILQESEEIPALGHKVVVDPGKEATCTETGLTEGKHCSVCKTVLVPQQIIPLAAHTEEADPGKEATCTEPGMTDGSHCSVCKTVLVPQQVIPPAGHMESDPVKENPKAGTCTEPGSYDSVVHCTVCGEVLSNTKVETDPLGHAWSEVSYTWNEDHTACTATRVCANDATHIESETVTAITEETISAGCETAGKTIYTAAFENQAFERQTAEIGVAATGHTWGEASYTWNEDSSACTAKRVCANDATHIESETVTAGTEKTIPAGCETASKEIRAAAFTNQAFETQKAEIVLGTAAGHTWSEVEYAWNGDYTACTATRTCTKDASHIESETVTAVTEDTVPAGCETAGKEIRAAAFTNQAFGTRKEEITLTATGHAWGKVEYAWNGDYTACTATRVCSNNAEHTESETMTADTVTTLAAGCETTGKANRVADFKNQAFETQTAEITLAATGHAWPAEPSWKWNGEMTQAEATMACGNDPTQHFVKDTDTEIDISRVDPDPINNKSGTEKYTAVVTLNGTQYTCEEEKTFKWVPKIELDSGLSKPHFPQEGKTVLQFILGTFDTPEAKYEDKDVEGSFEYGGSGLDYYCEDHPNATFTLTVTFTPIQDNAYSTVSKSFTLTFVTAMNTDNE